MKRRINTTVKGQLDQDALRRMLAGDDYEPHEIGPVSVTVENGIILLQAAVNPAQVEDRQRRASIREQLERRNASKPPAPVVI